MSDQDHELPELAIAFIVFARAVANQPNVNKEKLFSDLKDFERTFESKSGDSMLSSVFSHIVKSDDS